MAFSKLAREENILKALAQEFFEIYPKKCGHDLALLMNPVCHTSRFQGLGCVLVIGCLEWGLISDQTNFNSKPTCIIIMGSARKLNIKKIQGPSECITL